MSFSRKLALVLWLSLSSNLAFAVTNAQVFAWAAATYPGIFSGPALAGQAAQFDYRYFAGSGNAVAVDTSGTIFLLGPITGNALVPVAPVAALADVINAWQATQPGGVPVVQMGGARQGAALAIGAGAGVVSTIAGSGNSSFADGIGNAASFHFPTGITTDGASLFIADTDNNRIRKLVIATGVVTTLAGSGYPASVDGTGTAAMFYGPTGITTDGANLYVTDHSSAVVRKVVIATGVVTTLAGSGANGSTDGAGLAATFGGPWGITTDGPNVYVVDNITAKIRRIVVATGVVTTLAGSGKAGAADGTGAAASFAQPNGITTDGVNLYVVDAGNNKIRKLVIASGVVTTLAGSGNPGAQDGSATAASFNVPAGITSDGSYLYVGDSGNQKIRKVAIASGVVTTLAGSGAASTLDGTGTAATFKYPDSITSDGIGLFVADRVGNKVRRVQ
jgi:sugar lactone lactonase YvrE